MTTSKSHLHKKVLHPDYTAEPHLFWSAPDIKIRFQIMQF
jgi:hypothetical protein